MVTLPQINSLRVYAYWLAGVSYGSNLLYLSAFSSHGLWKKTHPKNAGHSDVKGQFQQLTKLCAPTVLSFGRFFCTSFQVAHAPRYTRTSDIHRPCSASINHSRIFQGFFQALSLALENLDPNMMSIGNLSNPSRKYWLVQTIPWFVHVQIPDKAIIHWQG